MASEGLTMMELENGTPPDRNGDDTETLQQGLTTLGEPPHRSCVTGRRAESNGPEMSTPTPDEYTLEYRPRTSTWKTTERKYGDDIEPFTKANGPHSIDYMAGQMWSARAKWYGRSETEASAANPTAKEWEMFFRRVLNGRHTQYGPMSLPSDDPRRRRVSMAIMRLASTDPRKVFKVNGDGCISSCSRPARAWEAAKRVLGTNYDIGTAPAADALSESSNHTASSDQRLTPRAASIDASEGPPLPSHGAKPTKRTRISSLPTGQAAIAGTNINRFALLSDDKPDTQPAPETPAQPRTRQPAGNRRNSDSLETNAQTAAKPPSAWPRAAGVTFDNANLETAVETASVESDTSQILIGQPSLQHTTRFMFKVKADQTEPDTTKALRDRIVAWFSQVQIVDPSAGILPWKESPEERGYIQHSGQVPTDLKELRTFFKGLRASTMESGLTYTNVRITTDMHPTNITAERNAEMNPYYYKHQEGLYINTLQVENTKEIGFLLYSGGFNDVKGTMELLNQEFRRRHKNTRVGGKLKNLVVVCDKTREAYQKSGKHWTMQPWRAIKVETESSQAAIAVERLCDLLNEDDNRPAGVRIRFLPEARYEQMTEKKRRHRGMLIQKHQAVLTSLKYVNTSGVAKLDDPVHGDNREHITLRSHLMSMKDADGKQIFQSLDMARAHDDQLIAHVFEESMAQASAIMSLLPAIARIELGVKTEKWFSPDAWYANLNVTYDAETKEYNAPDNSKLEHLLEEEFPASVVITNLPTELLDKPSYRPAALDYRSLFGSGTTIGSHMTMHSAVTGVPGSGDAESIATTASEQRREATRAAALEQERQRKESLNNARLEIQRAEIDKLRAELEKHQGNADPGAGAPPPC